MEELNKELTEAQVEETVGGRHHVFPNMPNPFYNPDPVTSNAQIYDAEGHTPGQTWKSGTNLMYVVKSGDSLYQIALDHNLPLDAVKKLNPQIVNFKWIHPGDVIMLRNDMY